MAAQRVARRKALVGFQKAERALHEVGGRRFRDQPAITEKTVAGAEGGIPQNRMHDC